jgi:hypothetical protein
MISLDANDPNQVASASSITADLGTANRKMLICSGIAIPGFNTFEDDYIAKDTAVVNLRQTVLAVEQATLSVGLASIGNGNTNFEFAIDQVTLQVDPTSQDLLLSVDMALMGNPSALDRFGYQVVAIITTQTTGISGTISWDKSLFDASADSEVDVAQLFQVYAGTPVPFSGPGVGSATYTNRAYGYTEALQQNANGFVLPYTIPGALYGVNLVVQVEPNPGFHATAQNMVRQISGPTQFVLTVSQPGVSDVDFFISPVSVPR